MKADAAPSTRARRTCRALGPCALPARDGPCFRRRRLCLELFVHVPVELTPPWGRTSLGLPLTTNP